MDDALHSRPVSAIRCPSVGESKYLKETLKNAYIKYLKCEVIEV
jgi:hypothetical protein